MRNRDVNAALYDKLWTARASIRQCWVRWKNDPTLLTLNLWKQKRFGWNIGLSFIVSKLHPTSLNIMLVDWTWWSNYPVFHWTKMLDGCWEKLEGPWKPAPIEEMPFLIESNEVRCWIVLPGLNRNLLPDWGKYLLWYGTPLESYSQASTL